MLNETSLYKCVRFQILLIFLNRILCTALNYGTELGQSKPLAVNVGGQDSRLRLGNVERASCYTEASYFGWMRGNVNEFTADEAVNVHAKAVTYYLLSNS